MKALRISLAVLAGYGITFLLVAFVQWDINPANWAIGARFSAAFFGSMLALCTGAAGAAREFPI